MDTANLFQVIARGQVRQIEERLKQGAEIDIIYDGKMPLHYVVDVELSPQEVEDPTAAKVAIIDLLVERGADVNQLTEAYIGRTPLGFAALRNDLIVAEALIKKGADVNKRGTLGHTALHTAATYGHVEMIRYLIGAGADVRIRDATARNTPLHLSVAKPSNPKDSNFRPRENLPDARAVEALIEAGSDVNAINGRGKTAADMAQTSEILRLLKQHGKWFPQRLAKIKWMLTRAV